jgi:hypothetical protein
VLEGSAKWQHDLFDDFEELPRRNLQQRLRGPADGFRLCALRPLAAVPCSCQGLTRTTESATFLALYIHTVDRNMQ